MIDRESLRRVLQGIKSTAKGFRKDKLSRRLKPKAPPVDPAAPEEVDPAAPEEETALDDGAAEPDPSAPEAAPDDAAQLKEIRKLLARS